MLVWNKSDYYLKLAISTYLIALRITELSFSSYYSKFWIIFHENGLRKLIILLNLFILIAIISVAYQELSNLRGKRLAFLIFLLRIIITLFFMSNTSLLLYTTFEISLIPIFIIIMGWGYQIERLNARLRIIFYTLIASLPILIALVLVGKKINTNRILFFNIRTTLNDLVILFLIMAFLVKTPMFLVHLWLPKAHVEAPVYGSMLLAALLLKLGTYGFYLFFLINYLRITLLFIFSTSFLRSFVIRLACIRILDIKVIIAYSSVAHMALVIFLFIILNNFSEIAGIGIIITHGFTSAPLFYLAYVQYERRHSRSIMLNKSVLYIIPMLRLFWFLILILNLAAPPSLNLLMELIIVINLIRHLKFLFGGVIICVIARTAYSLIIYSSVSQTQDCVRSCQRVLSIKEIKNLLIYLPLGFGLVLVSTNIL